MANTNKILIICLFLPMTAIALLALGWAQEMGIKVDSLPIFAYRDDLAAIPERTASSAEEAAAEIREPMVLFSHEEHFYEESIDLSLMAADERIVGLYYTLDGSPPHGAGGIVYTEPLVLPGSRSRVNSHTVRVGGIYDDGSLTAVYTHTYFIGESVFTRFDTLVISLTTDPYNLDDYDYGIAVPGRLRDEYIKESGDKNPNPPEPANFNLRGREAERPVHLEVIDQYGQSVLVQNGGIRVHGGWSRAADQKSFRIFARREYEPGRGRFAYEFFPEARTHYGRPLTRYDQILLRNNANDNPFAFLRDETVANLAAGLLPDTQRSRPAAVFLNGEYYGFAWLRPVYDKDHFNDMNEISGDNWMILAGGEWGMAAAPGDEREEAAASDYREMYDLHESGLRDEANFAELCARMDIDNFLRYYAVQIYANNFDWPWGNYKVYRYEGDTADSAIDGENNAAPYADGRWRWLLYDTDWTLALYDSKAGDQRLGMLMGAERNDRGSSPMLTELMRRDDMRERFVSILCDMMNHHFAPARIEREVRRMEALRANELYHNFRRGGAQLKGTWSNLDFVAGEVEKIIDFGHKRPAEMRKQIEKYLRIPAGGYDLNVAANEAAYISLNTCSLTPSDGDFSGFYYNVNTVTLTAMALPGYRFSHWLVGDEEVREEVITVGRGDAKRGRVDVALVLAPSVGGDPLVMAISHVGDHDYVDIYNPHGTDIDLRRYFISDNPAVPHARILADYILKAGEGVRLYGSNYRSGKALGGLALGFNLKSGETLLLSDMTGRTVSSTLLPRMDAGYILVWDTATGGYVARRE